MPQLLPFFFVNQVTFVFIIILISLYIFSKYILPNVISLFIYRMAVNKF